MTEVSSDSVQDNGTKRKIYMLSDNPEADGRWRKHLYTERTVKFDGELMHPFYNFSTFGYSAKDGRFPIETVNTLGLFLNPLRKSLTIEKWSPIEISVFEGSITLYGKNFNRIQKDIKTKTVKEIIEFYYDWKKTNHYKEWKKSFVPDGKNESELLKS